MTLGEVAEDRRHAQDAVTVAHLTRGIGRASEALLDLTTRRTPVAILGVAVVALFIQHQTIATTRGARTFLTVGLRLTVGRTTIERHIVAVIAALTALLLAVAAMCRAALARHAVAFEAELELAV